MALPINSTMPYVLREQEASKSKLQPEDIHVLLVDDERLSRTVVANLLRKCNYKVSSAENGAEAMQLLRSQPHGTFQLVLTDICMPEVNGIQLLQLVKQDDAFRSVPVIMMSSIEQDETVLQCVQGGAEEYLVKPVTKKELQHIWQHVWRKQLASAATVPQVLPQHSDPTAAAAAAVAEGHDQLGDCNDRSNAEQQLTVAAPPKSAGQQLAAFAAEAPGMHALQRVSSSLGAVPSPSLPDMSVGNRANDSGVGNAEQPAEQPQAAQPPPPQHTPTLPLGDFISSPAGLDKRIKLFGVAVALLQSCHSQGAPLLRLRPYQLGISPQGLRPVDQQPLQQWRNSSSLPFERALTDVKAALDALYSSPEEMHLAQRGRNASEGGSGAGPAGSISLPADMYSLGVLFVDLFLLPAAATLQERCAMLGALRGGALPAVLANAASSSAALSSLLRALLCSDARQRPSLAHLLRSGQLQEAYRQLQLLPRWSVKPAPQAQQPRLPEQAQQEVQAAQRQPIPSTSSQAHERMDSPKVDYAGLCHFLSMMRESKLVEAQALRSQLAAVDADVVHVMSELSSCAGSSGQGSGPHLPGLAPEASATLPEEDGGTRTPLPPQKRQRVCMDHASMAEPPTGVPHTDIACEGVGQHGSGEERLADVLPQLEEVFFSRRGQPGWSPAELEAFGEELDVVARRGKLSVKATLRCGDMASPMEMACCVAFDREDGLFATVGVSRRIKLFDFNSCLQSEQGVMHYPVMQMATRSKLSSCSWNAYIRQRLVTADYDGLIQLWDAATGAELSQFDEHARRVWSVEFSPTDPTRFLSGSDDGTVRLWSMHDESSLLRIKAPANVCSVQFSPEESHLVAFGCANYKVYAYDLRSPGRPLGSIAGPQRAVSYVRFMDSSHVVAASTDSTLRLWNLKEALAASAGGRPSAAGAAGEPSPPPPQCCYRGHRNQRNFVGLSVAPGGYIACGSEDNQVHCYYRSLPFSIGHHKFGSLGCADGGAGSPATAGSAPPASAHPPFVSAVTWANHSRHLLAANSQGVIQVLHMDSC